MFRINVIILFKGFIYKSIESYLILLRMKINSWQQATEKAQVT